MPAFRLMVIFVFAAFTSCTQNSDSILLPNSVGRAYELLVVMHINAWKGASGDSIRKVFECPTPALPQDEPLFSIIHIPPSAFNKYYFGYRNILQIHISQNQTQNNISVKTNSHAQNQVYIEIWASDEAHFLALMHENKNAILEKLLQSEQERLEESFRRLTSQKLLKQIQSEYKLSLYIPSDYILAVSRDSFAWLANETEKLSQGIFIWKYKYQNAKQMQIENLIQQRNTVLRNNVPGPVANSYMNTEMGYEIQYDTLYKAGRAVYQMRGLWRVEGDFMGGPFVSQTYIDTVSQTITTVEGFVYAGKQAKRNYLRQVEAIVGSHSPIN